MQGQGLHEQQKKRQKLETPVVEQLQAATEKVLAMGQFIEFTLEKQSMQSNGVWAGNACHSAGASACWKNMACACTACLSEIMRRAFPGVNSLLSAELVHWLFADRAQPD